MRRWAILSGLVLAACTAAPPGQSDSIDPVFRDRARETGLVFAHTNGMSGEFYIVEVIGSGAALFDYDNDGDLDAFLVQGAMLGPGKTWADATMPPVTDSAPGDRLFRNDLSSDGVLRFTNVTETSGLAHPGYGMGVIAADYDNDGRVDLYVTRVGGNSLWRNTGEGRFEDVTETSGTDDLRWSVPAVFFDYDRDGWLDLFVGNYVDFRYATHKQCVPEQGFVDYCSPLAYHPEPNRLFRNRGDGTFEDVTGATGLAAVAAGNTLGAIPADFDGDGLEDLYVANDWSENRLWINQGNGGFVEAGLAAGCAVNADGEPEASMGIVAADFDEDRDVDLFMTHLTGETNTFYRNDGTAVFEDQSIGSGLGTASREYTGFGTAGLDYDGDGWLDLFVANGGVRLIMSQVQQGDPLPLRQADQLFRNDGGPSFVDRSDRLPPHRDVGRGVAAGDVDNDGDIDLLIANNQGPARLLLNETPPRRWVGLRLVDRSGRDALGARAEFRFADGSTRSRWVQTAGSYASSSDPRILLALDDLPELQRVRVNWPDGSVEEWTDLEERRYTLLRQSDP